MSLPRSGLTTRRRILRGCGLVQWTMALAAWSLVVETGFRDRGMSPLWWGRSWTWWKRFSGTRWIKSASPLRAASAPLRESLRGEDSLLCRGLLMGTGGGWLWAFKHFPGSLPLCCSSCGWTSLRLWVRDRVLTAGRAQAPNSSLEFAPFWSPWDGRWTVFQLGAP